ncbi:LysR substrate-binding domain-containing protein, partial [Streptomyces mirabilis]|uniref:LysR substrate-binding domain-containing protein n=1 Tax=Streptomyces mirabilis TaxID=68239 RepID=UPI0036AB4199
PVAPHTRGVAAGGLPLRHRPERRPAACGIGKLTPADRQLETLGITPRVQVSTPGFNVLPFLVSGTDLVALVPERLARRYEGFARCAVVPTPFPDVPLVEAMYWHHNRHADPAHRWLRETVRKVGASLDDPAPAEIADVDASHGERAFPELAPAS